ncbi:hypothetical protein BRADI_3g54283v3 [Brachypodium distachyon]|uniref:Uncharacterized protein n=1 Tax=Brachypodium distachyon TaxID=15368 RepID=A0A0Q3IL92_BRADI|nr:hypothetical protein BRADI_3g54283v3 [Brachypodium distachyon]
MLDSCQLLLQECCTTIAYLLHLSPGQFLVGCGDRKREPPFTCAHTTSRVRNGVLETGSPDRSTSRDSRTYYSSTYLISLLRQ